MSIRYQPVLNPERLQMEGSVYSTDDRGPILGESTHPTLLQQLGRGDLFRDRLRGPHRILSVGTLVLVAVLFIVLLLFLLFGFRRVLGDIEEDRINSKYGLQLIPDLRVHTPNKFYYSEKNTPENNEIKKKYVQEIDEFLDIYAKEQQSRQKYTTDCDQFHKVENKWCRYSLRTNFQKGTEQCSPKDNYGFDSGEPCLLFAFKDEIGWAPRFSRLTAAELPFQCKMKFRYSSTYFSNVSYLPALSTSPKYGGFTINKIPSLPIKNETGKSIVDDDGEILYDLPPLVFVKFTKPFGQRYLTLICSILDDTPTFEYDNLHEFKGVRELKFDVQLDI